MFTQNYINFKHNTFFGIVETSEYGISRAKYVRFDGTDHPNYNYANQRGDIGYALSRTLLAELSYDLSQYSQGVVFGSGTKQPELTDYALEKQITSGLQQVSASRVIENEGNNTYSVCGIYTLGNTSEDNITISEIGIISLFQHGTSKHSPVLMERSLLSEPVTIAPGEQKQITYKLTFHH